MPTMVTQRRGRRWSAADGYLRPARRRDNLAVRCDTTVTRVVIEQARATGVEYLADGHRTMIRAEREVILAGGAINSPQLLMLSGIGPIDQLREHGLPVVHNASEVGQNLRDHLVAATSRGRTGRGHARGGTIDPPARRLCRVPSRDAHLQSDGGIRIHPQPAVSGRAGHRVAVRPRRHGGRRPGTTTAARSRSRGNPAAAAQHRPGHPPLGRPC